MKTVVYISVFLGLSSSAFALDRTPARAPYTSTAWTEKDGLSSNLILAMAQDHDGYLWLGTTAGLERFDGVRFVPWDIGGSSAIPGNYVTALFVARDGSLWIGSSTGSIGRLRDGSMTNYDSKQELAGGRVLAVLEDRNGTIWAGGFGGLFRFTGRRWELVGTPQGLPASAVLTLHEDRTGTLWVGTSVGVFFRHPDAAVFQQFGTSSERVQDLAEDSTGSFWVTDPKRAFKRLAADVSRPHVPPGTARGLGSHLMYDTRHNLWVASRTNGLFLVPNLAGVDSGIVQHLTVQDGLPSNVVQCLFEDREGNVWVGTGGGLARLSPIIGISVLSAGAAANAVSADVDGSVWVGTSAGLMRFANGQQRWFHERDGLPGDEVTALYSEGSGRLWVATVQGLARYEHGRFSPVPLPRDVRPNRIVAITTDKQGAVWLCDYSRRLFRLMDGILTPIDVGAEAPSKLAVSAYTDREGRVWIGFADGGVAVYKDGKVRTYAREQGLAPGRVNAIIEDHSGTVWIGTATGVARFQGDRFVSVLTRGTFPLKAPTAIVEDRDGYLWLGGTSGVVRIAPSEFDQAVANPSYHVQYSFFDTSDGLPASPAWRGYPTAARGADGSLWFETVNGISAIDPHQLPGRRPVPPVRIEQVIADQRDFGPAPNLHLPPLTSRLEIQYTALALSAATKIRFRYRLLGFDPTWVEAGSIRRALYANLPPGRYSFQVSAITRDEMPDAARAVLEFSIEPALYQTRWFYAACILAGLLTAWAAWQLRLRRIHHQFGLVLSERTRLAREIHDTLLGNLVGLILQLDVMSTQTDSSALSLKPQLLRLREQLQQHLREARRAIWDLRSPFLATLASSLAESGHKLAVDTDVTIDCVVSGTPRRSLTVDTELLRIGQEAMSNAVRHSHAHAIRVALQYEPDCLILRVEDDGVGFEPQQTAIPSNHWGMRTMQERADRIGARLGIRSMLGTGTTIEVVAPLASSS